MHKTRSVPLRAELSVRRSTWTGPACAVGGSTDNERGHGQNESRSTRLRPKSTRFGPLAKGRAGRPPVAPGRRLALLTILVRGCGSGAILSRGTPPNHLRQGSCQRRFNGGAGAGSCAASPRGPKPAAVRRRGCNRARGHPPPQPATACGTAGPPERPSRPRCAPARRPSGWRVRSLCR